MGQDVWPGVRGFSVQGSDGYNLVPEASWLSFRYRWNLEGGAGLGKLPIESSNHLPALDGSEAIEWRIRARGRHFSLRIQVNQDESLLVDPTMDLKETVGALVKPFDLIELRCLDQTTLGIIAPAMIPTAEDETATRRLRYDGVGPVPTDIMESTNLVVLASNEEDRVASWECQGAIVTSFGEDRGVENAEPCLSNNASAILSACKDHVKIMRKYLAE